MDDTSSTCMCSISIYSWWCDSGKTVYIVLHGICMFDLLMLLCSACRNTHVMVASELMADSRKKLLENPAGTHLKGNFTCTSLVLPSNIDSQSMETRFQSTEGQQPGIAGITNAKCITKHYPLVI